MTLRETTEETTQPSAPSDHLLGPVGQRPNVRVLDADHHNIPRTVHLPVGVTNTTSPDAPPTTPPAISLDLPIVPESDPLIDSSDRTTLIQGSTGTSVRATLEQALAALKGKIKGRRKVLYSVALAAGGAAAAITLNFLGTGTQVPRTTSAHTNAFNSSVPLATVLPSGQPITMTSVRPTADATSHHTIMAPPAKK